jgi:hypothetical protein
MRVLGFMSLHYGGDFFKESLLSIRDHVEKMHIAYSKHPSHGFGSTLSNPDKEEDLRAIAEEVLGGKLIWETYENFHTEAEHREMRYNHSAAYSLILTIDPDEIFKQSTIQPALDFAYYGNRRWFGISGYKHFWKTTDWYFEDHDNPIRIENLTKEPSSEIGVLPMTVYHMSLCQREEIIRYKFDVFGHKNEIKPNYIEEKFLAWTPDNINQVTHLHPTRDDIWIQPTRNNQPIEELKNYKQYTPKEMKLLWIPMDFHRHTESPELFTDILDAFKEKHDTMIFQGDYNDAIAFKPNVILFQSSITVENLNLLKKQTNALVCMWTGDASYLPSPSLLHYKNVVDCYLLPFSGKSLEPYTVLLGKPCHFLWEPIQKWRYKFNKSMIVGQTIFVGRRYRHLPGGDKRLELKEFLGKQLDVDDNWFGMPGCAEVLNEHLPIIYNDAYIVICENNYDDLEEYFTPRNIGAMAAGTCTVHRYFPGIEKHIQNYHHGMYYRNKYELLEILNYLVANPDMRNKLAENGFKLASENFAPRNWVKAFENIMKGYL